MYWQQLGLTRQVRQIYKSSLTEQETLSANFKQRYGIDEFVINRLI